MNHYKMRIHVEMIPCNEAPPEKPVKADDGSVSTILSETDALSIDACEKALLETTYPVLRETLATHVSDMAPKKACEHAEEGTVVRNTWPYRVDGELGRLEFPPYLVCQDNTILYDTSRDLFSPLGCWERYETIGCKELALIYGLTERSSRKTETLIRRIRPQEGATGSTTLRTSAEREGKRVMACLEGTTTAILQGEGFAAAGQPLPSTPVGTHTAKRMSAEQVNEAIDACGLSIDERPG